MAATLLNRFKQQIASLEMVPSSGGRFEIDVDGQSVYSKLETGQFPDESEIVEALEQRTKAK